MDKCHSAAGQSCSITGESVTLLWLDAPYDDGQYGNEKRFELAFLKSTTLKLARRGVLAFVIPQRIQRLAEREEVQVVNDSAGGRSIVVFWASGTASALDTGSIANRRDVGSVAACSRVLDGVELQFGFYR